MPDEYVETGTAIVMVTRIEYEYIDDYILCKFCAENGDVIFESTRSRRWITEMKQCGWNSRSLGIQGFVLETWDSDNAYPIEVPVLTRVPDEDVPAMYIDERPL